MVNAHSHLELTGLEGQVQEDDFPAWIRHIIQIVAGRTHESFVVAAKVGIKESWSRGVTTVADCGS
ncbi:MAG: hypothetical protein JF590_06455, partial [Gemmatimonadetes bacterium]|nr:hypothetical protein [Gemmatimonadota bacterium]